MTERGSGAASATRVVRLLLVGLVWLGCADSPPGQAADAASDPRDTLAVALPSPAVDSLALDSLGIALHPAAGAGWKIREIRHAPRHFLPAGWVDASTLWGLAGSNPVLVAVDRPEFTAWNLTAWGATLSPDGRRMAWIDERGISVGSRGEEPRLVLDRAAHAAEVEGDLSGPPLWSPDGARLLVAWTGEGLSTHGIVELSGGELTLIPPRGEGYLLSGAFGWLDAERILFSAPVRLGTDGSPERGSALAVYELGSGAHRRVTREPEEVSLRPVARWSDAELLVEARTEGSTGRARHRIYHTRTWAHRAIGLPVGSQVVVHDSTRVLVARPLPSRGGNGIHELLLWNGSTGARPLALAKGQELHLAWSRDGHRLAVGARTEEPVEGQTGSFRTRYRTWVVAP